MPRNEEQLTQTQRLECIRKELLKEEIISTDTLARRFDVSGMTIRRDFEYLESQGEVVRTHGGAALAQKLTFEFAFRKKHGASQKQKIRIAQEAVKHVKNNQVVMLDTGTTTLQIARALVGKRSVRVITTSLAIVSELQFASDIEVILLGGVLRDGSPDLHGPLTEQAIEQLTADIAFIGADAIDPKGNVYTGDLRVINIDRKMASHAEKVIVVADSCKFGRKAMCKIFGPGGYHMIISDTGMDKELIKQFARNKIPVTRV
jgi:DeoR/GlpR family transcriptional regulator of sugar metabolism